MQVIEEAFFWGESHPGMLGGGRVTGSILSEKPTDFTLVPGQWVALRLKDWI